MQTPILERLGAALAPVALCAATALGGCGGAAVPHDHMADAQAAYRSAEELGAQGEPQAAYHLELAQEQLVDARQIIEDEGDMERASRLLVQAEADANLAIALTNAARTRADAHETRERIQNMRERAL